MRQKETVASVQIRRHDSVAVHDVHIAITEAEQVHDVYIVHVAISLSQHLKDFTWFPWLFSLAYCFKSTSSASICQAKTVIQKHTNYYAVQPFV